MFLRVGSVGIGQQSPPDVQLIHVWGHFGVASFFMRRGIDDRTRTWKEQLSSPPKRHGSISQDPAGPHLPATFRTLRHKNFRLFFFGQMISLVGTWMQTIAQQWLAYRLTGSAAMLGTVNLVAVLPLLPMSL